jgi:hypothetical protein
MPIVEDNVKQAMGRWLEEQGYERIEVRLGTRQGYDVEGIHKNTHERLVIECKGEAQSGSQHNRSWPNVASAILTSLNETEDPKNNHTVGMAFPDTPEYRDRMHLLQDFCKKQKIHVFWVTDKGLVSRW